MSAENEYPQAERVVSLLTPDLSRQLPKTRLGGSGDGGYVVPSSVIPEIRHAICVGVGADVSFECDLCRLNPFCAFTFYDHDIQSFPANSIPPYRMTFIRRRVQTYPDVRMLVSGYRDLCLKIDIEGDEYGAFSLDAGSFVDLSGVSLLVLELHCIADRITDAIRLLEAIRRQMVCVHAHVNGIGGYKTVGGIEIPNIVELTFMSDVSWEREAGIMGKEGSSAVSDSKTVGV